MAEVSGQISPNTCHSFPDLSQCCFLVVFQMNTIFCELLQCKCFFLVKLGFRRVKSSIPVSSMGPEDSNPALKLSRQALLPTGPSPQFHELLLFLKNGASTTGCWKKITGLNRASGTSPMWVLLDLKAGSSGPLLFILL